MFTVVLLGISLIAVSFLFMKRIGKEQGRLLTPRPATLVLGIQIICGDCCGEEELPRKTFLDINGNCAQCGGSSYVLVSSLAGSQSRIHQVVQSQNGQSARIIPFRNGPRLLTDKKRIAV